ncbi:BRO-like protein [Corynebacterium hylobatis]|uniref:BRO-like protein n=1 Tax=Corynebacterium hylobatis TaxID=1859290 RepID=A0A3S0HFH2_9CORY|nr:phage antirepressor [Corynebacterium hylobatis]RSZ61515.1 BRO-like protein [Corynebacterium hylobatis]
MAEIQMFDFRGHDVRAFLAKDGEPRWVATDVARILGYASAKDMTRNLDEDEKGGHNLPTLGGAQIMTVITESGLYAAILRSRKVEAKEFKRWVTREVLPSIRRHGAYMTPTTVEQILTDPDTLIKLATDLKASRERAAAAENRARVLEAPAKSWEHLAAPGGDFSVSAAAKVLSRDPEISLGRDRLFKHMATIGWIFRTKGHRPHWEASQQKAIDTGRLTHKLSAPFFNERTEEWEQPNPTIRITPKGLHQLHRSLGGSDQTTLFQQELNS